ncbi:hypothetical protein FB45DRAFT_1067536 [Roridomyces roridus]|uniref:F-box domain-containing protein n=1 Tax=Roridomyces roridus TaxID=1738132 RepID=A0AAD7B3F3_9AGAR|nr:hypothetical protein FB45DRAFT_1067536 [Roridomyces roridus]
MSPTSPPPILLLPDELLIEITAVQPQKSLTPEPPSEWVLSHVCSRFRRAVTGACTLWTRIVVDLCCDTSAELFRLYLKRSAAWEMDVTLRAMDSDLPAQKGLQYLSPHVGRIERLTIIVEARQALETILSSLPNVAMPALQHLEIENSSDRDIDLLDLSPLKLPNITCLKMTRCTPSFPPLQWMRALTHLHLEDNPYPVRENSDIFRFITTQHTSLVYLYLDLMKAIFPLGSGIVSQSLTHLDLEFNEGETNGLLNQLASFDTPQLTHLGLHCAHGDQLSFLLNSNMQSTFPAVTSLTIDDLGKLCCDWTPGAHRDYAPVKPPLRLFPALSSLTLIRECLTPRMVSDLFGPGSQPWLELEVLAIRPRPAEIENVYRTLQEVVCWKRSQQESLPTFKLSANLFEREFWAENGVVVELLADYGMIGSNGDRDSSTWQWYLADLRVACCIAHEI